MKQQEELPDSQQHSQIASSPVRQLAALTESWLNCQIEDSIVRQLTALPDSQPQCQLANHTARQLAALPVYCYYCYLCCFCFLNVKYLMLFKFIFYHFEKYQIIQNYFLTTGLWSSPVVTVFQKGSFSLSFSLSFSVTNLRAPNWSVRSAFGLLLFTIVYYCLLCQEMSQYP